MYNKILETILLTPPNGLTPLLHNQPIEKLYLRSKKFTHVRWFVTIILNRWGWINFRNINVIFIAWSSYYVLVVFISSSYWSTYDLNIRLLLDIPIIVIIVFFIIVTTAGFWFIVQEVCFKFIIRIIISTKLNNKLLFNKCFQLNNDFKSFLRLVLITSQILLKNPRVCPEFHALLWDVHSLFVLNFFFRFSTNVNK